MDNLTSDLTLHDIVALDEPGLRQQPTKPFDAWREPGAELRQARQPLDLVPVEALDRATPAVEATRTRVGPRWRLLLIGDGPVARALASTAQALDYEVWLCDPRPADATALAMNASNGGRPPTLRHAPPDEAVRAFGPDALSAVITLTNEIDLDEPALLEALRSPAFYVGAVGSVADQPKRRQRLRRHSLSRVDLDRLHDPVGVRNGARTPAEIAVAIMAHMTAARYGVAMSTDAWMPARSGGRGRNVFDIPIG